MSYINCLTCTHAHRLFLSVCFLVISLINLLLIILVVFRFVQCRFPCWTTFHLLRQNYLQPVHKFFCISNIIFSHGHTQPRSARFHLFHQYLIWFCNLLITCLHFLLPSEKNYVYLNLSFLNFRFNISLMWAGIFLTKAMPSLFSCSFPSSSLFIYSHNRSFQFLICFYFLFVSQGFVYGFNPDLCLGFYPVQFL